MLIGIILIAAILLAGLAGVTGRGAVDSRDPEVSLFRVPRDIQRVALDEPTASRARHSRATADRVDDCVTGTIATPAARG